MQTTLRNALAGRNPVGRGGPTLRLPWLGAAALLLAAAVSTSHASSFTVQEWIVETGISGPSGSNWSAFTTVVNPFVDSHSAALGLSTAQASYDFAWTSTSGRFQLQTTHEAEGVNASGLLCGSDGQILIAPSQDLSVSIHTEYTYDLPADSMVADLVFAVLDSVTGEALFSAGRMADTTMGPVSGTMVIDDSFLMPPGHVWRMGYLMRIITSNPSAGHIGLGNGFVDIQINAIPEPATVWLLALGALGLRKRTRRRRS